MRTWTRVQDGVAADHFSDETLVPGMDVFVGVGEWVESTDLTPQPSSGWRYDGSSFSPPPQVSAPNMRARTYKSDIWRRCTEDEAPLLDAALTEAPARLRRLWDDSTVLMHEAEEFPALQASVITLLGDTRAAELLAASYWEM